MHPAAHNSCFKNKQTTYKIHTYPSSNLVTHLETFRNSGKSARAFPRVSVFLLTPPRLRLFLSVCSDRLRPLINENATTVNVFEYLLDYSDVAWLTPSLCYDSFIRRLADAQLSLSTNQTTALNERHSIGLILMSWMFTMLGVAQKSPAAKLLKSSSV